MISYSPTQSLSSGKANKAQTLTAWVHADVSGLDVQFIKTLSKIWLLIIAVLVFSSSLISSMSDDVALAIVEAEGVNAELLSTNVDLQIQKRVSKGIDVVTVRAADLGLYKPLAGQVRVYLKKHHSFGNK